MFTPELEFMAEYTRRLRARLALAAGRGAHEAASDLADPDTRGEAPLPSLEDDTLPIVELMKRCSLDRRDADILLFAAAVNMEPPLRASLATLAEPLPMDWPSPWTWLQLVSVDSPDPYWVEQYRFDAGRPLRRHGLVEIVARDDADVTDRLRSELVVPSDVVGFLRGEVGLDDRLEGCAERIENYEPLPTPAVPQGILAHLTRVVAGHVVSPSHDLRLRGPDTSADIVLVAGGRGTGKSMAVLVAAQRNGVPVLRIEGPMLSTLSQERVSEVVENAVRQAALQGELLLIDGVGQSMGRATPAAAALLRAARRHRALVALVIRDVDHLDARVRDSAAVRVQFPPVALATSQSAWELALDTYGIDGVDPRKAAARYPLDGRQVFNATRAARLALRGGLSLRPDEGTGDSASAGRASQALASLDEGVVTDALNLASLTQLDDNMGKLGTSEGTKATLDDLVLTKSLRGQVEEIISAFKHWHTLYDDWGFGERVHRGRGLICLFDGDPGTGKTMCAEILANELDLKLVRVNTGQVIDKYIGETEKRLGEIFHRAHPGLNLLLFDEADSLFGKRTKVERSTDRYANAAINVLLQLVEHYEGLVVLTTNLKQGIDPAFERRFTYKLRFETPGEKERRRIWRLFIPDTAPVADDIDYRYLGEQLELTGGGIKTAVIRAAYLALKAGEPLSMDHLLEAGYRELAATGKLVRQNF